MVTRLALATLICVGFPPIAYAGYSSYSECLEKTSAHLSANVISYVQQQLKDDGLSIRRVDGLLGSSTKRAISAYRAKHGLAGGDAIDANLLETMAGPGTPAAEEVRRAEAWCSRIFHRLPESESNIGGPQPLTRLDCEKGGSHWNENTNVCE